MPSTLAAMQPETSRVRSGTRTLKFSITVVANMEHKEIEMAVYGKTVVSNIWSLEYLLNSLNISFSYIKDFFLSPSFY